MEPEPPTTAADAADSFEPHRRVLFGAAYRMLGSVAEAEDVVQDAYLRWSGTDRERVEEPRAFLLTVTSRLALDRLRSARVRREAYVGPWLPEPVLTGPDAADQALLGESVSMALLVVLETLSPLERAVFVLREVFGYSHAEVADVLGRSEAGVRQLAHRAREHVQARRPRYPADADTGRVVVERFRDAAQGGDLEALLEILAPDVVAWSDGGGRTAAARRPVEGAERVAQFFIRIARRSLEGVATRVAEVNGDPALLVWQDGALFMVMVMEVSGRRIHTVRTVLNPDKLSGLQGAAP